MRLLDSAERHSSFISEMQSACNGTAWEADVHKWWNGDCVYIRIHHTEETLKQQYTGEGENVYAPDIYFDEDPFGKEGWGFKIQTTSYGALKTSEIEKFTASYHQAVALVHKLSAIINEYYPTDTATKWRRAYMNKNMGKFLTHLALDEWDGYMTGKGQIFEAMVRDEEAQCDVYVFAPELSRERWGILIVTYGGSNGCSKGLHAQINKLAEQLGALITYVRGDD